MKIACFGSINLDIVYNVHHIPQGGETISSTGRTTFWGGKGLNQSTALAKAYPEVFLMGFVNKSEESILKHMEENNISTKMMAFSDKPTGHAIIHVDSNAQNCITLFAGSNHSFTEKEVDKNLDQLQEGDLLLLQNEINLLEYIIKSAHSRGIRVVLNPSPFEDSLLDLPLEQLSYLICNEIEGGAIVGDSTISHEEILKKLSKKFPKTVIVLTLGGDGVLCYDQTTQFSHGTYQVEAVDTTAAGDTFTGFFMAQLAKNASIPEALELASKAAAIAVSREGATTSIPTMEEVISSKLTLKK
ncbi:MAG: ribokinase [Eubacteriales bacterium]